MSFNFACHMHIRRMDRVQLVCSFCLCCGHSVHEKYNILIKKLGRQQSVARYFSIATHVMGGCHDGCQACCCHVTIIIGNPVLSSVAPLILSSQHLPIFNFRVAVIGANLILSQYILINVQMNYLVLCYFLLKLLH